MSGGEVQLEDLANRLRTRVAERRYREARSALAEYCRALRAAAAGIPPGDPRLRKLERLWYGLLEETRCRVLAGRAHTAARLARMPKVRPGYLDRSQPRHTWQILG